MNGVPGKGDGAAPVGKAGWAATIAGFLELGTDCCRARCRCRRHRIGPTTSPTTRRGRNRRGNPPARSTPGGFLRRARRRRRPDWSDRGIAERQKRIADLATAIRDETKARIERIRAMQAFGNMGIEEIRHLKDTGASTDEVRRKIDMWKASVTSQATALGWTQEEIGNYIGGSTGCRRPKKRRSLADTTRALEAITGIADKITGILDPPAIRYQRRGPIRRPGQSPRLRLLSAPF